MLVSDVRKTVTWEHDTLAFNGLHKLELHASLCLSDLKSEICRECSSQICRMTQSTADVIQCPGSLLPFANIRPMEPGDESTSYVICIIISYDVSISFQSSRGLIKGGRNIEHFERHQDLPCTEQPAFISEFNLKPCVFKVGL